MRWLLKRVQFLILAGLMFAFTSQCFAQQQGEVNFEIGAQSLSAALQQFSRQSGVQVVANGADIATIKSTEVKGAYTAQQALQLLLQDSGLAARKNVEGDFIIERVGRNVASNLETVVVVGKATNALITSYELEAYQANDLADIFRLKPSISVGGGASGITQKIYVRGLEDSLINVTVDGSPQTSTLFHHIGRVTIDPDLLKEVDVQAGAGEATSGAGAIGGSIRFKTKDVNDLLAPGESFSGRIKVNTFSNDGEQFSASFSGRLSDSWGVLAYYNSVERENAEDGDGVELEGSAAEQKVGFLKISGEIGGNQYLSLSYENRDEEGEFPRQPNWAPVAGALLYSGEGERETVVANYQLQHSDLVNLEASVYNTEAGFQRELFTYNSDIKSTGFDVRNTSVVANHRFTVGIDMRDDEVASGEIGTVQYVEEGKVTGLYAQGHSQVTTALMLSYGVRYDDYEFDQLYPDPLYTAERGTFSDTDVSLNAGLAYDINNHWSFSLGYAEALRGKEIGDGFTTWGTNVTPNLEAESVSNTEASLEYGVASFNAKFAVFRSEIDEVIFDQLGGPILYENIGSVETDGFEFDLAYRWNSLDAYLGFASHDSVLSPAAGVFSTDYGNIDLEGYEYNGLGNSRGDTWNVGISYNLMPSLALGWNMTHVDDLNNLEVLQRGVEISWIGTVQSVDKPGYNVHDIYVGWTPLNSLKLNLAVTNLLDKTYLDHSSVADYNHIAGWEGVRGYNEPGRDIRLSAIFNF